MIVPWLRGFVNYQIAPITWALIILNAFIYFSIQESPFAKHKDVLSNQQNFELTAKLYNQYKGSGALPKHNELNLLGAQALRDPEFIGNLETLKFRGDEIEIEKWRTEMIDLRESLKHRRVNIFGLNYGARRPLTFLTYQFMHASLVHLLSNAIMLLIFAAALEGVVGGFTLVSVYILGGIAGAFGFLLLAGPTVAPMVGASGSLSAVMAFYILAEKRKRVQFFYFLSPVEGYYGWIWLPTWMIFPFSFVSDISAYFGTSAEVGSGVAYTAHIGGMVFGLAAGLIFRKFDFYPLKTSPTILK